MKARIIKEKRPKAFLLENVAGIVSQDNGKTLDTILNILNELDYNVSWKLLNAKHYGVPQNRNRWYCVGVDRRKKNINLDNIFPNECDLEYTLKDIINNKRKKDYTVSKIALGNIKNILIHI